jgi:hypothetical protein
MSYLTIRQQSKIEIGFLLTILAIPDRDWPLGSNAFEKNPATVPAAFRDLTQSL